MTKTMPKWLETKLILDGVMTTDHVTKHARPRRCPHCGLFTLVGLDDLLPKTVAVDPLPTTSAGELFALLTGRRSFALDAGELYERTAGRLLFRPADTHPVYATHQCGSLPLPVNEHFMPKPQEKQDGPPPF